MLDATATASPAGEFVSRVRRFVAQTPRLAVIFFVLLLAVPTALVAIAEGAALMPLPFNLFVVDQRLPGIFKLHMLASGAALLLIPLTTAVRRDRSWHKPLGRLTAVLVLLGGLTSLPVAFYSHSVAMARAGFFAQGIVWLTLIALGVAAIRKRQFADHARLMLAMAAVASGALWVRLTTAVVTLGGLPFDQVYGCVAWLGWMVPLAVATLLPMPYVPARR
jgi:Predicted membrane protein (DUF2306)